MQSSEHFLNDLFSNEETITMVILIKQRYAYQVLKSGCVQQSLATINQKPNNNDLFLFCKDSVRVFGKFDFYSF